jgi:subtilisin family serine protease
VRLVAPGGNVTAAARGQGLTAVSGTSFAAPFVSATAALIRQHHPGIHADQVIARILATTDPAPGGNPGYGNGILNPYRAVTEQLSAAPSTGSAPAPVPPAGAARPTAPPTTTRATALVLAAVGVLLAGLIALAATVLPRGAARRWRPGRT